MNIFEQKYGELKKVSISELYGNYIPMESLDGKMYVQNGNELFPTDQIFEEKNRKFYEMFFEIDFDKLKGATVDNVEIIPAKLQGHEIKKGTINIKSLEKTIESPEVSETVQDLSESEKTEKYIDDKINKINSPSINEVDLRNEFESIIIDIAEPNLDSISLDNEKRTKIFKNIISKIQLENERDLFIEMIQSRTDILDESVINEFQTKREEQAIDTPSDTNYDEIIIDEKIEKETEITEEHSIEEGPAITQYKKDTEELRKQLEALEKDIEAKNVDSNVLKTDEKIEEIINKITLNPEEEKEIKELNELINNLIEEKERYIRRKENFLDENPNYKNFEDLTRIYKEMEESIVNVEQEIEEARKKVEIINNKKELEENTTKLIEVNKLRDVYEIEIPKLESILHQLEEIRDKFYKENKGIPLEIYGMMKPLEFHIEKMKKDIHEKCGIRFDINVNTKENIVLIENIKEARNLYSKTEEIINQKYSDKLDENKENSDKEIEELKSKKESLKNQLSERENNISTYYDALNDIKDIENDINKGKTTEEEQSKVEAIHQKITTITDSSLKEELNKYLQLALESKEKKDPTLNPETPPTPEPTPEVPIKSKLKVIAKKALKWMKEHKLVTIGLGLALVTALMFAIPQTHMMINSALWNIGKSLGWSANSLSNLHGINLGLAKGIQGGKFIFEGMSGAYTLGGAVGAQALYGAAGANLVAALTGLTGLGAIGTFGASIINKIKNRKKKDKPIEDKPIPEKEPVLEPEIEEKGKDKEKEIVVEKTGDEKEIENPPEKEAEVEKTDLEQIKTVMEAMKEQIKNLEEQLDLTKQENIALKSELERIQSMETIPEMAPEMEESHVMKLG